MKLLRCGPVGAERPCAIDAGGQIRDLSGHAADFVGEGVSLDALAALRSVDLSALAGKKVHFILEVQNSNNTSQDDR